MTRKYNIIYADPPWEYKESGSGSRVVKAHYPTMNIEDIKGLPIQDLCAEQCILFLWVTFPRLAQGLEVIKSWGFEYYGLGFDWVKTSKNGKPSWGMGYYTRQNTEICLIGVPKDKRRRLKPTNRDVLSIVHSQREEHSKKPDCIRDLIVRCIGDLPRVELFARQKADGWDSWGNEVECDIELANQKETQ